MCLFAELTDGRGKVPLSLRLTDVDDETEIFRADRELDIPDPLAVMLLITQINGVVFPAAGEYRLQLHAGNEPLMERRLLLQHVPQGPPP